MGKRNNIAMYAIINSAIGLNICDLFSDNLLLNSKDKKDNKKTNKSNNDILFEKELVRICTNFQPNTQDLLISINPNLNSILLNLHLITIQPVLRRSKLKKARSNANRKSNTNSHISASNDLDLSIQILINSSNSIRK